MNDSFSRIELMLDKPVKSYNFYKIAIFGVGGVGGYALEALVRSGFINIDIYDYDVVSESNLNRQIIATINSIGKKKVEVAKKRAETINPDINIHAFDLMLTKDNMETLNLKQYDFLIDAIDMVTSKLALIKYATDNNIKIISSMGTGNKLNPSKLEITDLYKTTTCPLARVMRKECKALGIKHLVVLASKETPKRTNTKTPGSMIFVPASAGLLIASYVFKELSGDKDA